MSQQTNLLLPELRPRFDWLGLPAVLGGGSLLLAVVLGGGAWLQLRERDLLAEQAVLDARARSLQPQLTSAGQRLQSHRPDPRLAALVSGLQDDVALRREALQRVGQQRDEARYAQTLVGFSRRVHDGVWLVGFMLEGGEISIQGRLADAHLLPGYIAGLRDDPAFSGRRFAALRMAAVAPPPPPAKPVEGERKPAGRPYTEFTLRSSPATEWDKAPDGERKEKL